MAGYDGFSKSNNAVYAEDSGLMTASALAAEIRQWYRGVQAADITAVLTPTEWHHTSSHYNITNYYNPVDFFELGNRKKLKEILAAKKVKKVEYPKNLGVKKVEWLEWSGSRKHPVCSEKSAEAEIIQTTEKTYVFIVAGRKITKREGTNGFFIK